MVLAYAVKDGRLAVNPAAGVSLPRVQAAEKRFLTTGRFTELADACGKEYRLLVLFLAYTGLRWGEMAALRVAARRLPATTGAGRRIGDPGEGRHDVRADERSREARGAAPPLPRRAS